MNAVDLFAGAGGLSQGLVDAGFDVRVAVELDPVACESYSANHRDTALIERDVRFISSREILDNCGGGVDLLTACPPCQGFSTLTNTLKRDDPRNSLIIEVIRLISDIRPKAIMIENVPGLGSKGKSYWDYFKDTIAEMGYCSNEAVLQVADFGVPQYRRRLVLLAGLGFEIPIPEPTHGPKAGVPYSTVRDAISGLARPVSVKYASLNGGAGRFNWHVYRDLSDINKERLRHVRAGGSRFDIPEHLRPRCHQGKNSGYSNTYTRMRWVEPSPTITSGCTTISTGRFGHPQQLRGISVREAALLQTFPKDYIFSTNYIEQACRMVGNALPCMFAKKLAKQCFDAI